jgi:hypothetical protein
LHLPDAVYGNFQGILMGAYIPACMLYGYLCKRLPLATLLLLATFAYIMEAIPLLFVHSSATALWMALPMGLINGFAFAAYWDLALRSCPPGLQGTLMMLVAGAYELAYRAGDLVGANVYGSAATHGFLWCVILATATSVLMLPVLRLIPKQLIATADGEPDPAADAASPAGSLS